MSTSSLQQYLGAAMLLVALVMVLVANHMDERVASCKTVLQLNACIEKPTLKISPRGDDTMDINDERTSLLKKTYDSKVRPCPPGMLCEFLL